MQALSHLKVLDLTQYIAGPYCTKLMAGFGADVIKIERTHTGDKMRSMGPFFKNEPGLENSIPFLWLNTGKKSITLQNFCKFLDSMKYKTLLTLALFLLGFSRKYIRIIQTVVGIRLQESD